MRLARPAALVLTALLLGACGAAPLPPAASRPAAGVQARGVALQPIVDGILDRAEDGDPDQVVAANGALRSLARGITVKSSADFADLLVLLKAQRQLVHHAARQGDGWVALAATCRLEASKTADTLARLIKSLAAREQAAGSPGQKGGHERLLAAADMLAVVDAAGDLLLDRFPAPTPAMVKAMPTIEKHLGDRMAYMLAATTLIREVARTLRSDAEVDAFLDRLDAIVAKAVADENVPREAVAKIGQFVGRFHDLEPRGVEVVRTAEVAF